MCSLSVRGYEQQRVLRLRPHGPLDQELSERRPRPWKGSWPRERYEPLAVLSKQLYAELGWIMCFSAHARSLLLSLWRAGTRGQGLWEDRGRWGREISKHFSYQRVRTLRRIGIKTIFSQLHNYSRDVDLKCPYYGLWKVHILVLGSTTTGSHACEVKNTFIFL